MNHTGQGTGIAFLFRTVIGLVSIVKFLLYLFMTVGVMFKVTGNHL